MQEVISALKYPFAHTNVRTNTFFLIWELHWGHSLADSFEHTFQCQETDKVLYIFEASLALGITIRTLFVRFNRGVTLQKHREEQGV